MQYKGKVVDAIIEEFNEIGVPLIPEQAIMALSEHDFVEMFRANIQHIEFQIDDNDVTVIIELLPYTTLFPHV